jgi:hypothetical protein
LSNAVGFCIDKKANCLSQTAKMTSMIKCLYDNSKH